MLASKAGKPRVETTDYVAAMLLAISMMFLLYDIDTYFQSEIFLSIYPVSIDYGSGGGNCGLVYSFTSKRL